MSVRAVAVAFALCVSASTLLAQAQRIPSYAEFRADMIAGDGTAAQVGAGLVLPLDNYVRFALIGAAGPKWRDGATIASGRIDAIARFTLDPLRETPWALSLGGGVSVPLEQQQARVRPLLTAVIDVEARKHGRFTPAVQVGLGGGTRVGFAFRTSSARYR